MTQPHSVDEVPEALFDPPGTFVKIDWKEQEGRLVLIWAHRETPFTWEGETSNVIEGDVVVLDPPTKTPIQYKGVLIFPKVLQGQVRGNLGRNKPNLGRVQKGIPRRANQSPPWELVDPNAADQQLAVHFLKNPSVAVSAQGSASPAGGSPWGNGDAPPF